MFPAAWQGFCNIPVINVFICCKHCTSLHVHHLLQRNKESSGFELSDPTGAAPSESVTSFLSKPVCFSGSYAHWDSCIKLLWLCYCNELESQQKGKKLSTMTAHFKREDDTTGGCETCKSDDFTSMDLSIRRWLLDSSTAPGWAARMLLWRNMCYYNSRDTPGGYANLCFAWENIHPPIYYLPA